MENMTLGQLAADLALVVGIITALAFIVKKIKKWITKLFSELTKPLEDKINTLGDTVQGINREICKNYLISYLSDVERGISVSELERRRFYEEYEKYRQNGGNSYIKARVDKLTKQGKL